MLIFITIEYNKIPIWIYNAKYLLLGSDTFDSNKIGSWPDSTLDPDRSVIVISSGCHYQHTGYNTIQKAVAVDCTGLERGAFAKEAFHWPSGTVDQR